MSEQSETKKWIIKSIRKQGEPIVIKPIASHFYPHIGEIVTEGNLDEWMLLKMSGISHISVTEETMSENDQPLVLARNNTVKLPYELTNKLKWFPNDELYIDMFDEELQEIVIGKKLEGEQAVKAMQKLSEILDQENP